MALLDDVHTGNYYVRYGFLYAALTQESVGAQASVTIRADGYGN